MTTEYIPFFFFYPYRQFITVIIQTGSKRVLLKKLATHMKSKYHIASFLQEYALLIVWIPWLIMISSFFIVLSYKAFHHYKFPFV